jgi:hypothetical protein
MNEGITNKRAPSKFRKIAMPKAAPAELDEELEAIDAADSAPDLRKPLRGPMRDENPRERAAKRAAELRQSGTMQEGPDVFYVDPNAIPDGWSYEWKRRTTAGQEDPAYQVQLARMGWEPVPASRHPEMMPLNSNFETIERKGMVLMERPAEISDEAKRSDLIRARQQVQIKKQQLSQAPDGQFTRDDDRVRPKVKSSYEPMPVPKDR